MEEYPVITFYQQIISMIDVESAAFLCLPLAFEIVKKLRSEVL